MSWCAWAGAFPALSCSNKYTIRVKCRRDLRNISGKEGNTVLQKYMQKFSKMFFFLNPLIVEKWDCIQRNRMPHPDIGLRIGGARWPAVSLSSLHVHVIRPSERSRSPRSER
jgi:hypothetical protein